MERLSGAVVVAAPQARAWSVCSDFERFPEFIAGITSATALSGGRWAWVGQAFGLRRAWNSLLVAQRDGECIAWVTDQRMVPDGRVVVESLGPRSSRVSIEMRYAPDTWYERLVSRTGLARVRLHRDLAAFRRRVELTA